MLQICRMGCGSSKNVVLQQSASREQLVCSDVLSQDSFGSVQPQRDINDEKSSSASHTNEAEIATQTNICVHDGTQITSNHSTKPPHSLLDVEINHTPLESSAATQPQTSNMYLSPKEHNTMTADFVCTSTTLSMDSTNEHVTECTQRKYDESYSFPGPCEGASANLCCIGQESNSGVECCSNVQDKETVNDRDYGGGNISQTSYTTAGLDQLVTYSAVNINGPFSIAHLHWERNAYSRSQSYRIQTLQLQLGFIEKITVNGGKVCMVFRHTIIM